MKKDSASSLGMRIIETAAFTRRFAALADEESKQSLLDELVSKPDMGDLIKGGGGLRKLRWASSGRGKRGGMRVIYYWQIGTVLYLLTAYPKNKKDDLSPDELALLKRVVDEEKKSWTKNSSKS